MRARAFAAVLVALGAASCVELTWQRVRVGRPLAAESIAWVLDDRPTLAATLDALGAPHRVRRVESEHDAPEGTELVWIWRRQSGYSVSGSVPLEQGGSASFEFADDRTQFEGLRVTFDLEGGFLRAGVGAVASANPELGLPLVP